MVDLPVTRYVYPTVVESVPVGVLKDYITRLSTVYVTRYRTVYVTRPVTRIHTYAVTHVIHQVVRAGPTPPSKEVVRRVAV